MKRFLFIIMVISVLSGIAIAAKSESNSLGVEKKDAKEAATSEPNSLGAKKGNTKEIATAAKSEPNKPSVKKKGAKEAAKSEPNVPSVKKEGAKEIAIEAKPEPNRPAIEEQDVKKLIASLARSRQHSRVIEEGTKLLLRTDLKSEDKAFIRLKMAETYEAMPFCGRLAKEKYGEILEMHPEYIQNAKVAYRLAELNDGITLKGTTPNTQQAIDCYRYIIERSADRSHPEHGMQYATLKAHRGLGLLCYYQHEYEEARKHFEAIYNCEPEMLSVVPGENPDLKHPENIGETKAYVLKRLKSMRADMPKSIVSTCIRSDPEESLEALRALMKAYASDPNVSANAQSVYEQEVARRDSLRKMIEDDERYNKD